MKLFAMMSCGELVSSYEPDHGVEFIPMFKTEDDAKIAREAYGAIGEAGGFDDSDTKVVSVEVCLIKSSPQWDNNSGCMKRS